MTEKIPPKKLSKEMEENAKARMKEADELANAMFDSLGGHDIGAIIIALVRLQTGLYGNLGLRNRAALREQIGQLQKNFATIDFKDLEAEEQQKPHAG